MHARWSPGAAAVAEYGGRGGARPDREESGVSRMTLHRHRLGREEIFQLSRGHTRTTPGVARGAVDGSGSARIGSAGSPACASSERHLDFLRGLDDEADTRLFHVGAPRGPASSPRSSASSATGCATARSGGARSVDGDAARQRRRPDVPPPRIAHGWSPARSRDDLLVRGLALAARLENGGVDRRADRVRAAVVERAPRGLAARLDRAVERPEVAQRDVLYLGRDDEKRELPVPLRALDAPEDGRAREGLHDRRQRGLVVGRRFEATHDVEGDDRALGGVGHRVDGEVFEDAAVDEEPPAARERRDEPGDRHARADRLDHVAPPVNDEPAREEDRRSR